jgi:hypothetical protein
MIYNKKEGENPSYLISNIVSQTNTASRGLSTSYVWKETESGL